MIPNEIGIVPVTDGQGEVTHISQGTYTVQNGEDAEFPTIIQEPGIDTANYPPAPYIPAPIPVSEPAPVPAGQSVAWPGVAWLLVFITYIHRYASRLDSVYAWAKYAPDMGGLPRNLTRKKDHHGNEWEVIPNTDFISLTKQPDKAKFTAAETAIETIRRNVPALLREYFMWKKKLPQRVAENAEPHAIKEAREAYAHYREELEVMKRRYDEAYGFLENASKIEYRIPIASLDNLISYDMQLESMPPVPVAQTLPQPIVWPDFDSDDFNPEHDLLREAARVGALK